MKAQLVVHMVDGRESWSKMDEQEFDAWQKEQIRSWLQSKPTSTWGRMFDLIQSDSLENAVNWFHDQLKQYDKHVSDSLIYGTEQ